MMKVLGEFFGWFFVCAVAGLVIAGCVLLRSLTWVCGRGWYFEERRRPWKI